MRHIRRLLTFVWSGMIGLLRASRSQIDRTEPTPSLRSSIGMFLLLSVFYFAFCTAPAYLHGMAYTAHESTGGAAAVDAAGDQAR